MVDTVVRLQSFKNNYVSFLIGFLHAGEGEGVV